MENLLTLKNIIKSIAGLIVFIILLVTLLKSFYQIESGTRGSIARCNPGVGIVMRAGGEFGSPSKVAALEGSDSACLWCLVHALRGSVPGTKSSDTERH